MRLAALVGFLGLISSGVASSPFRRTPRDYDKNDYYLLHLDDDTSPHHVSARLGLEYDGQVGVLDHLHVFSAPKSDGDFVSDAVRTRKLKRDGEPDILDGVRMAKKDVPRKPWSKRMIPPLPPNYQSNLIPRVDTVVQDKAMVAKQEEVMSTLGISDPIFKNQWHLINTQQPGEDINVTGVWLQGITGEGSIVAMVDDGIDMTSNDLKANYYAEGSWDFNDPGPNPAPRLPEDHHGTRCAGEIAAVRNDVCGVGVAYDAKISGLRILSKIISDEDEAVAMTYDYQNNQIYSCSWGPPDDGRSMEAPSVSIRQAMLKGIQEGRGGKGSIYVFASGNGAANEDNCNFDGYTNSIYSITVGAVDRTGGHPYYSEHCSAQLVVTYSSGGGDAIHTTDVGANKCYSNHGGTSAAAPLAAGIFALVLQARPDLSWRDMQYIAMETAQHVDADDWKTTAIGKQFSHTFGYGKIDTYGAVELAKTWDKVKPQAWYYSPWIHINQDIPQDKGGLAATFEITEEMLKEANLERVEHVTLTMNVNHTRRGDLSADLISPNNVVSHVATTRKLDVSAQGYDNWTFMSVAHWGESGVGKWTVVVRDTKKNDQKGFWIDWHLKLWGESIDPEKATKLPMPQEDDDDDHSKVKTTTITAVPGPTTEPVGPTGSGAADSKPTDVPPQESGVPSGSADEETPTDAEQASGTPSNWVSWLPTFGVSSQAQVWIYGAIGLIVIFCVGLGIYLYVARRRRLRNDSGAEYEFEPLAEDVDGYNNGEKGAYVAGGQSRRTRGGELYDAFAGGSEDEDEEFEARYKDHSSERLPLSGGSGSGSGSGSRSVSVSDEEEEAQHVIGDDDDSDDDGQDGRLLSSGGR